MKKSNVIPAQSAPYSIRGRESRRRDRVMASPSPAFRANSTWQSLGRGRRNFWIPVSLGMTIEFWGKALVSMAVRVGKTRLIDNRTLEVCLSNG
jgi:hypothetical protein